VLGVFDRLMTVAESRFFRSGIVKGLSSGPLSERVVGIRKLHNPKNKESYKKQRAIELIVSLIFTPIWRHLWCAFPVAWLNIAADLTNIEVDRISTNTIREIFLARRALSKRRRDTSLVLYQLCVDGMSIMTDQMD
jgi:hypothetical protein